MTKPAVNPLPEFREFRVMVWDRVADERVEKTVYAHSLNVIEGMSLPSIVFLHVVGTTDDGLAISLVQRVVADVLDVEDLGYIDGSGRVQ